MADGHGNDDKRIIVDFPAISFWLKELTDMYARRFDHLEQELAKANEKLDKIIELIEALGTSGQASGLRIDLGSPKDKPPKQ